MSHHASDPSPADDHGPHRHMAVRFLGACLLSGGLLALAGPPLGFWPLVFVAWVPVLIALLRTGRHARLTRGWAFAGGFFPGLILFTSLLFWLVQHNVRCWFVLTLAMAFPFGLASKGFFLGMRGGLRGSWLVLWIACVWTAMEAIVWSWLHLPYSAMGCGLWRVPVLIQTADLWGVFGISFWIMLVNAAFACTWVGQGRRCRWGWALVLVCTGAHIGYGLWQYHEFAQPSTPTLRAAIVQSAIATEHKFERPHLEATLQSLCTQTLQVTTDHAYAPDVVIWPETSVPVFLASPKEEAVRRLLFETAYRAKTALLIGGLGLPDNDPQMGIQNATFLVSPPADLTLVYRKRVLAPYYETMPFHQYLPSAWQRCFPPGLDEGEKPGLVTLGPEHTLGVLTCWEALMPALVYDLVRNGATCLVNMTNDDAAFKRMKASYSVPVPLLVFRAVETRRALLRAANRGLSLAIEPSGRIATELPFGQSSAALCTLASQDRQTVFVHYGPWFTHAWIVTILAWGIHLGMKAQRGNHADKRGQAS